MIVIVSFLEKLLPNHNWYCSDVDTFGTAGKKYNFSSKFLKKIGSDRSMINFSQEIDQFLSGVFLAIEEKYSCNTINLSIGTEDDQFRPINIEGVLLEIRAFDTSFFEIYSDNKDIIEQLSNRFNSSYQKK